MNKQSKSVLKARQIIVFASFLFITVHLNAQLPFKFDSLYRTLYAKEFCMLLKKNPDVLLIDVRTKGEFNDTSHFASLNQGHLKGAINIEIDSIKKNVHILDSYKNKTLVFYCSHSQRSRRVSKLLIENGFTDFYNMNGGMSVLNQLDDMSFPCKKDWIVSGLPFKNLSFNQTDELLQKEKKLVVIDTRPANQFNSNDTVPENNIGRIKNALHIPYSELKNKIGMLVAYKNQPILVYSASGDGDGIRTAGDLANNGFKNVYQLLGGINNFVASQEDISFIENSPSFVSVDAYRALQLLKNNKNLVVLDTRSKEEYNNQLTGVISYKNLGHIKNAIHAEGSSFQSIQLPADPTIPFLIYGGQDAYRLAKFLIEKGYKKVYVLRSFYDFVWSGFNIENCKEAKQFLVDHQGLY